MQIYRINVDNIENFAEESGADTFAKVLLEWKLPETFFWFNEKNRAN